MAMKSFHEVINNHGIDKLQDSKDLLISWWRENGKNPGLKNRKELQKDFNELLDSFDIIIEKIENK